MTSEELERTLLLNQAGPNTQDWLQHGPLRRPIDIDQNAVKQLVDEVLKPLEPELTEEGPTKFTTVWQVRSKWFEYKTTKSFPFGMP